MHALLLAPLLAVALPAFADDARVDDGRVVMTGCAVRAARTADLSPGAGGLLAAVDVRPGDRVAAGDVLATLRDAAPRASLERVARQAADDADLRYARKASELAQAEFLAARDLNAEIAGARPEAEIRRLRLAAERALLAIEQAESRLEQAELQRAQLAAELEGYRIVAPFAGTVLRVSRRPGEACRPGEPVVEIADLSRLRVIGAVPLADAWRVRRGQPVAVRATVPGAELPVERETFVGRVTFVSPVVREVAGTVEVWGEVDDPRGLLRDGLGAGMAVDVSGP